MTRDDSVRAIHGGDLDAVAVRYGIAVESLLDFSANINPLGPPPALTRALRDAAADLAALQRYPEPGSTTLRAAIARREDLDPACIVIANGAAALIETALAALDVERCAVPIPAFSEDRRALWARGIRLVPFPLGTASNFMLDVDALMNFAIRENAGAVLVTNPHNPSGALLHRSGMRELLARARDARIHVILDEAFIDFAPGDSVTRDAAALPNTIVLRSLTKFFAVPALRVGYAVCEPHLAERLRARIAPWPVTTIAARALEAALDDRSDYAARSRESNARARTDLERQLTGLGITVYPSSANFLLLRIPGASSSRICEGLVRGSGIVVRDCASYEGLARGVFVRVAVRDERDNAKLVEAIRAVLA